MAATKHKANSTIKPAGSGAAVPSLLTQIAKEGFVPKSILIIGKDRIRKSRVCEAILANLKKVHPGSNQKLVHCEEISNATLEGLSTENNSPSLFGGRSVIVLDSVDQIKSAFIPKLLELTDPKQNGLLHFVLLASTLQTNSTIRAGHAAQNLVVEFNELSESEMTPWALREFKALGVKEVASDVPAMLVAASEQSLDNLAALINLVALYSDNGSVSKADCEKLFTPHSQQSDFALVELANAGKSTQSEMLLSKLISNGKSPFALLGLLNRSYSTLLCIRTLKESALSDGEIQRRLNLKPWLFNKHIEALQRFTTSELSQGLEQVLIADAKLKNKSLGPDLILGGLLHNLKPRGRKGDLARKTPNRQ